MNDIAKGPLIVIVAALAVTMSACTGGSGSSPGVAAVGPAGATQQASAPALPGEGFTEQGSPDTVSAAGANSSTLATAGSSRSSSGSALNPSQAEVEYAHCMRSHGVADFPDPSASGAFQLPGGPNSDLNPTNPTFQRAQTACQSIMSGSHGTPAQEAEDAAKLLQYAVCMRSHGVPNFPDPFRHADGGYGFLFTPSLDQNSSTFQAADKACHSLLP